MSGLAHYLEEEGLSTVVISLIRVHSEKMHPPRALWVPFELGRPLGAPSDPAFQHKVLAAALELFQAPQGPIIADFNEDAPDSLPEDMEGWACPVDLTPPAAELSDSEALLKALQAEISQLSTWYELAKKNHGRTTVGASQMEPAAIADFLGGFLEGGQPDNPRDDLDIPWTVKLACEDLKAYYTEAATAKPGSAPGGSAPLLDWFWGSTVAGQLLLKLQKILAASEDKTTQLLGNVLVVPSSQAHRKL